MAVRAGRACHPAEAVDSAVVVDHVAVVDSAAAGDHVAAVAEAVAEAAAEAGGRHEKIRDINSRTFKGEKDNASRNEQ